MQTGENLEKKPQQKENLRLAPCAGFDTPTNAEASKSTTKHNPPSVFGEQLFMQFCYLGTEKGPFLKPQLSFSSSPCLPSSVLLKPKPRAGNSRPGLLIKTMENNGQKNLLGLTASPCSTERQELCHSTHMSIISHGMTHQSPCSTRPTSPSQRHSPVATSFSKEPMASSQLKQPEEKAAFCLFFPQAREEEALSGWLDPSKSNVKLLHYSN